MDPHVHSSSVPVSAVSSGSALSWLRAAARRRKLTASVALAIALFGTAIAVTLPDRYTAKVILLPPQQSGSAGAAMMAQLSSMAGAAAGTSGLSIKNPNDQQIALLKSRIVEEALVARFHLQALYGKRYVSSARKRWEKETSADNGLKDGLIRLTVTDSDPRRAAEMANTWVDEYRSFTASLAVTEASQRRLFYERQLGAAHEDLAHAEAELEQTEQRTGVIDIEGQDRGMIASAAVLRGQLAAKQIEIKAMREFAADGNPDLERAEQEASGMEGQLAAMDAGADRRTGDLIAPPGKVTEAATEYENAMREVKYRETIQELLMRQYEGARVDEARQGALIQVVEPAAPPDRPSPYRFWILFGALLASLPLGVAAAQLAESASVLCRFASLFLLLARRSRTLHGRSSAVTVRPFRGRRLGRSLGLDGPVAYTLMARVLNIVSSTGTVLLILHFFSPVEQGYYYTLLSLVALQMIFELGFSFVILQLAAHESARLEFFADGRIGGDPRAHARLASVLQLTMRWYLGAAVGLAVVLLPLGVVFFSRQAVRAAHLSWFGPWAAAVAAVSLSFFLTPLFSFLEGANHVRQVARARMQQALAALVMSWAAIASGHGLYAPAMVNFGVAATGAVLLFSRRRLLAGLMRYPPGANAVSWRFEVWPFQWKIAVSWLASYLTLQVFTPILFAFRGPLEAGRMGLSLSIVTYIPFLALCWITPKAAPFGRLVQQGRMAELEQMFFQALRQPFALACAIAAGCLLCVLGMEAALPKIALRMEPVGVFALLSAAGVSSFVVQALAVYLRSFKREPYLAQSMATAALTTVVALFAAHRWGGMAIAIDYFTVTGVVGLAWAARIFAMQRRASRSGAFGMYGSLSAFAVGCEQREGAQ